MKNILFILLLIVCYQMSAQSLYENDSLIIWNKNRPIIWEDFKGTDAPEDNRAAWAAVGDYIKFIPKEFSDQNLEDIKIITVFEKHISWKDSLLVRLFDSENLLNHERTHFNITELYARKIRKKIGQYIKEENIVLDSIATMYYDGIDKLSLMQIKYDQETNHSLNKEKQKEWTRKIDSLLQVYRAYEVDIKMEDLELEE